MVLGEVCVSLQGKRLLLQLLTTYMLAAVGPREHLPSSATPWPPSDRTDGPRGRTGGVIQESFASSPATPWLPNDHTPWLDTTLPLGLQDGTFERDGEWAC